MTDRMFYIIVKSVNGQNNFTLTLTQDRTIMTLVDGVAQEISFSTKRDISKLMIFPIPDGSYTFSV